MSIRKRVCLLAVVIGIAAPMSRADEFKNPKANIPPKAAPQRQNAGDKRHVAVVSNDNGATWSEPTRTGFFDAAGDIALIRGAIAYDAAHDRVHACWVLSYADGGVYYRCYSFTRDGSSNITGITRVRQVCLERGTDTPAVWLAEAPFALWCADTGAFVCGWGVSNSNASTTKAEARCTMRVITNDANDVTFVGDAATGVATTWVAPLNENAGAGSTDLLASAGLCKYSCLAKSASATYPFLALARKGASAATHAKDLVFVSVQGGNTGSLFFNRATWAAGTSDWRTGLGAALANDAGLTTVSAIKRTGTDAGYNLKYQLISKLAIDTVADKIWVGCSTWKDNTAGDTWTLWSLSGADAVSAAVDVYAATAANTDVARDMFTVGDVMYDVASGLVATSYTDLPRHDVYVATYDNGVASQAGVAVYTATPCDIPTIYDVRVNSKLGLLFRDFPATFRNNPPTTSLPYTGYYVSVPLAAQTAAAAATPTPSFLATAPGGLGTWRR